MPESAAARPDDAGEVPGGFASMGHRARRAAALAGELAHTNDGRRALAPEVVAELRDSGLLRTDLPTHEGGAQATPGAILEAAETVARGDASAGWCVSIGATSSLLAGYLPAEGAAEVFHDPRSLAAGVWAPRGTATPVDGGVTVSGRWSFCSGITHSEWFFAGCLLADDGSAGPVMRVVAMPTAELEILDTWHTSGLRGTGSHDSVATELFVPARRVLSVMDGPPDGAPPLYRFPLFGFFASSIAAAALGNARGAIDDLVELAAGKRPPGSSRTLAERSATQAAVAVAEASLRAARLFFFQSIDEAWQAAQGSEPVPVPLRMGVRLAAAHATRTAAEVATSMYDLGGGSSIYESSPLQRRFRDADTATADFQVNPAVFELTGRLLLGLPTRTEQL